jgi:signal transduction histidine kinase
LDAAVAPPHLPAAVELAAYRIVQEALTNVTRHAHATHAWVTVRYADDVTIEIADDGVGLNGAAAGNGLTGMTTRAAALGGTLDFGDVAGGGLRVLARIPLNASVAS